MHFKLRPMAKRGGERIGIIISWQHFGNRKSASHNKCHFLIRVGYFPN